MDKNKKLGIIQICVNCLIFIIQGYLIWSLFYFLKVKDFENEIIYRGMRMDSFQEAVYVSYFAIGIIIVFNFIFLKYFLRKNSFKIVLSLILGVISIIYSGALIWYFNQVYVK
jgi:hypothetical protein